jgi:hypothetical protein
MTTAWSPAEDQNRRGMRVAQPPRRRRTQSALRRRNRFQPGRHGRQPAGHQETCVRGEHGIDLMARNVRRVPAQRRVGVEAVEGVGVEGVGVEGVGVEGVGVAHRGGRARSPDR